MLKTVLILFLFVPLFPFSVYAQQGEIDYRFSGFADTYHAVRSQSPYDFMSSRSRLRTELNVSKGNSYLFVSLNSVYNGIDEDQSKIELREAFFEYTASNWNFKVGKQIVVWGVADGLRITDIVAPMDYSEFLARDYDDIRIPVNAFQLRYNKPNYNAELIFIPIPEFFILPVDENNPWSITQSFEMPYDVTLRDKPEKTLKNSEIGGRFSFYLSGIDFSISALHTWNKMPVFNYGYSQDSDTLLMEAHYDRFDMLGLNFSMPVGQFVMRGELAGYFDELQEVSEETMINKNSVNLLLGVDWYAGNDWTVMAQYYYKKIGGYDDTMSVDKNTSYFTFSVSKKVLRSTLNLSSYLYMDAINKAYFDRTSADYSLSDQIHIMAGFDWFHGDQGSFSYYQNNSEYWLKLKYSF